MYYHAALAEVDGVFRPSCSAVEFRSVISCRNGSCIVLTTHLNTVRTSSPKHVSVLRARRERDYGF